MHPEYGPVAAVAEKLRDRFGDPPQTAIVLGSGLGVVVDRLVIEREVSTEDLGLPSSTVPGHAGKVITGTLGGAHVLVLSGRVHLYEGYPAQVVVRYVRAFHHWGVQRLILTCAAGGIAAGLDPGSLVLVTDHLNFQYENPLTGTPWNGNRFPDVTQAHHPGIRATLLDAATSIEVRLDQGVYAAVMGPAYETPAETFMLRSAGADIVGMSTVPEILAAAQVGLPVGAIALISNRAAGLTDGPVTHAEVTDIANRAGDNLARLLEEACGRF
ncbi:MAG: purine-nucleoside phosphorylase [Deltaproteobacteria bacterium]|nr:purine-nucleoside phosphorylase [Deltaproteobacteria bacterium]